MLSSGEEIDRIHFSGKMKYHRNTICYLGSHFFPFSSLLRQFSTFFTFSFRPKKKKYYNSCFMESLTTPDCNSTDVDFIYIRKFHGCVQFSAQHTKIHRINRIAIISSSLVSELLEKNIL